MFVPPDLLAHHPATFEAGLGDFDNFYVHGVVDELDVALDRGEYAYEIYAAGRIGLFPGGTRHGLDAPHGCVDDDDPADPDRLFIQSTVLRRRYQIDRDQGLVPILINFCEAESGAILFNR